MKFDKTVTEKFAFGAGDYLTSEYYEELYKRGFRTTMNQFYYYLNNPKGEKVHFYYACKDGYKHYLETLPENLL